jgi:hypothetical protein
MSHILPVLACAAEAGSESKPRQVGSYLDEDQYLNNGWLKLLLLPALTLHLHLSFSHGHLTEMELDFYGH